MLVLLFPERRNEVPSAEIQAKLKNLENSMFQFFRMKDNGASAEDLAKLDSAVKMGMQDPDFKGMHVVEMPPEWDEDLRSLSDSVIEKVAYFVLASRLLEEDLGLNSDSPQEKIDKMIFEASSEKKDAVVNALQDLYSCRELEEFCSKFLA